MELAAAGIYADTGAMLVAENVAVEASTQLCVRVSGQAGAMFKGCKLDSGDGGVLVTELSTANLQNCTIDGSHVSSSGSAVGSTGIVVSCGGQVKAQDLKISGITCVGVMVDGAESSAEMHACEIHMSENLEQCSVTETLPLKITSKGSVVLTNCGVKGGLGGVQVCATHLWKEMVGLARQQP